MALVGQVARQEGTDQGVHLIRPIEIRAVAGTSDHMAADASLNGRFASGTDLDAAWRCGLLGLAQTCGYRGRLGLKSARRHP